MQNKDREDNAFPFVMLLVILLGLASLELDEVVTSSSQGFTPNTKTRYIKKIYLESKATNPNLLNEHI